MLMEERAALTAKIGMLEDIIKALSEQKDAALLQNDDLKKCLRGLVEQIVVDARSTGPFKIVSSKGLKEAMTFAWRALEIHEKTVTEKPKDEAIRVHCLTDLGDGTRCWANLPCRIHAVAEKRKDVCPLNCLERWPDLGHRADCPTRVEKCDCGSKSFTLEQHSEACYYRRSEQSPKYERGDDVSDDAMMG